MLITGWWVNNMKLYIDIETIPTQNQVLIERIRKSIKCPGNITKTESIEEWYAENSASAFDEKYRKTSFDGLYGELLSIAFAIEDGEVQGMIRRDYDTETDLLKWFFESITNHCDKFGNSTAISKWIGQYITGFDLRFIWQRCVVNQYKPPIAIPYDIKPWDDAVFDTKIAWTGASSQYSGASKQDDLCAAFGLSGKGDIDGSKVYDYWLDDRLDEILEYNKDDVFQNRQIYKLLTFDNITSAAIAEVVQAEKPVKQKTERKPRSARVIESVDTETSEIISDDVKHYESNDQQAVEDLKNHKEWRDKICACESLSDVVRLQKEMPHDIKEDLRPALYIRQDEIKALASVIMQS
jgi:predicted PolB exonuclease-like 3'-5' exonuclease